MGDWKCYATLALPDIPLDAIFCHSYCLTTDRSRLTTMTTGCVEKTLGIAKRRNIPLVLFSNAYDTWAIEARFKDEMATRSGVDISRVCHLSDITNTYDEIRKLKGVLLLAGGRRVAIVADRDHMPRILYAIRLLLPEVQAHPVSVRCKKFERSLEPSRIKSIRLGHRSLWVLWNILGYILLALGKARYTP